MNEIQIWNTFNEDILKDISQNNLNIKIQNIKTNLPKNIEIKVENNFQKFKNKIKNNSILFLLDNLKREKEKIIIPTHVKGFKYTHAFNRNPDFYESTNELAKYKLLSISTHCHILTKDNKLLFGTKKNQFNQITGFSGFPNVNEDSTELNGEKYLDIYKTIFNRLKPEIGYLVNTINSITAIGITYVNTKGLRGLDLDYLIKIDEFASKAKERFNENQQFEKFLYDVEFEPEKIRNFIEKIHKDKYMSKYALGCIYAEIKSNFGKKEAEKTLTTIKKIGVNISTNNETNYFKI